MPRDAAPGEECPVADRLAARGAKELFERTVNRHARLPHAGAKAYDFADALRHHSCSSGPLSSPLRPFGCGTHETAEAESSDYTSRHSVRNLWRGSAIELYTQTAFRVALLIGSVLLIPDMKDNTTDRHPSPRQAELIVTRAINSSP